jgi:probable addiction module antidote protein
MKTTKWDPAEDIHTTEEAAAYHEAALEENDLELLLAVIGDITRSKAMAAIAGELTIPQGLPSRPLTTAGNPSFAAVSNTLNALGYQLTLKQKIPA